MSVGQSNRNDSTRPVTPGTAAGTGPYDSLAASEQLLHGLVDFGSLLVPVPPQATAQAQHRPHERWPGVHIEAPAGYLRLHALAAPRSSSLWAQLSSDIFASLDGPDVRVEREQGRWGVEITSDSNESVTRFIGVDGPRWVLYGVATGPAELADEQADTLRTIMGGTVVVRGDSPYPVSSTLPLANPPEPERAGQNESEGPGRHADPSSRTEPGTTDRPNHPTAIDGRSPADAPALIDDARRTGAQVPGAAADREPQPAVAPPPRQAGPNGAPLPRRPPGSAPNRTYPPGSTPDRTIDRRYPTDRRYRPAPVPPAPVPPAPVPPAPVPPAPVPPAAARPAPVSPGPASRPPTEPGQARSIGRLTRSVDPPTEPIRIPRAEPRREDDHRRRLQHRLLVLEAVVAALHRHRELVPLVAGARNRTEAVIAIRRCLDVGEASARAVLELPWHQLTADRRRAVTAERDELRSYLYAADWNWS